MSRPLFQFEAFCIGWYELKYDLNLVIRTNKDTTSVFTALGWSVAKWQQLTMSVFAVWGWSVAKWWQLKMTMIENECFHYENMVSCKVTTVENKYLYFRGPNPMVQLLSLYDKWLLKNQNFRQKFHNFRTQVVSN